MSIEPLTSANSTVTCFRSPSSGAASGSLGAAAPGWAAAGGASASSRPHELQKRCPAGFSAPQPGQGSDRSRLVPQDPQNRDSAGFEAPHRVHVAVSDPLVPIPTSTPPKEYAPALPGRSVMWSL